VRAEGRSAKTKKNRWSGNEVFVCSRRLFWKKNGFEPTKLERESSSF
jgi:hypothetical protein